MTPSAAPARTVLVLGANGRFGLAAAQAFAAAGWKVVAHVRRDAAAGMPASAELVRAPLAALAEVLQGNAAPDVVVHGINPIYTRWAEEALPAARAAMDLAERFGARFMLPGNVYNYGAAMPARLDEATPQRPTTAKGRIRADMESELERRAAADRLRSTVITAGDFFGAGSGSWFDEVVVKSIAEGTIVYPGDPGLAHAWAYLPDLARAFVAVASAPDLPPFERFAFAGHSVTGVEFIAALEQAAATLGFAPRRGWRRRGMPWALIRVGGLVVPLWRELATMSYLWRVPHRLDGAKLASRCPRLASTPLAIALAHSLAALAAAPAGAPSTARATG